MTLREMQEKREKLLAGARERLNEIDANTDESRATELEAQHDAAMAELDQLDKDYARRESLENAERRSELAGERLNTGDPRRPDNDGVSVDSNEPGERAATYDGAFDVALRHGVAALTDEQRSLITSGRASMTSQEARALGVGVDAGGGYTVPEGFVSEIDRAMAAWGPMYDGNIVRELNTSTGNDLPWPGVDDTAKEGEDHAEGAAARDDGSDDVVFDNRTLKAYFRDTGIVRMSYELLQDSAFSMEELLNDLFAERLGRRANRDLTTGSGIDAPQGIVTGAGQGKVAASADAIAADELIDLLHSVDPAYRSSPKARWQFNDLSLAAIKKLKDGDGNYLWQMGDVRAGEPSMLLGHPYSVNQAMDNIAANNSPIIFGDHGEYVVRKIKGFTVMTLRERYAEKFQVGMIGYKRYDGRLLRNTAVKRLVMPA